MERESVWDTLNGVVDSYVEFSAQYPGANLRKLLCVGQPLIDPEKWYTAPAIYAMNMLVGFRILPTVWEHIRSAGAQHNESVLATVASLLHNGGRASAPFVDKRPNRHVRQGDHALT